MWALAASAGVLMVVIGYLKHETSPLIYYVSSVSGLFLVVWAWMQVREVQREISDRG